MKRVLESRLTIVLLQTATPPQNRENSSTHTQSVTAVYTPLLALPAAGKALNGRTRNYHPLQMAPLHMIQHQRARRYWELLAFKPFFTLLIHKGIFIKSYSWYSDPDLCSKARLSTSCKYCCSLHWLPTHTSWRKLLIPYWSLRRTRDWWQNKKGSKQAFSSQQTEIDNEAPFLIPA